MISSTSDYPSADDVLAIAGEPDAVRRNLWITWSFISVFYGDYGLWMHEVDRVASGQVPYRDFSWEYPPLALMLDALAARWFSDNIAVLFTLSAIVSMCVAP